MDAFKLRYIMRNGEKVLQQYLFMGYVPVQDSNGEFVGTEHEAYFEWVDIPIIDEQSNIDRPKPFYGRIDDESNTKWRNVF